MQLKEIVVLTSITLFIVFVVSTYIYTFNLPLSTNENTWGLFGDYIGGILNPSIGLLVFIYIVLSYNIQKKELKNASIAFEKQNYDNHFFQLLNNFKTHVNDLKYLTYKGSDIFQSLLEHNKGDVATRKTTSFNVEDFKNFYPNHSGYPKRYFSFLEYLLSYVDKNEIENIDTGKYICLIKLQLSQSELIFIAFHALTLEDKSFKNLIDNYNILEYLDSENDYLDVTHLKEYQKYQKYQKSINSSSQPT